MDDFKPARPRHVPPRPLPAYRSGPLFPHRLEIPSERKPFWTRGRLHLIAFVGWLLACGLTLELAATWEDLRDHPRPVYDCQPTKAIA